MLMQVVLARTYGGRESSTHCNSRKHMQIEKAPANQENIFINLTAVCFNLKQFKTM